MTAAVMVTVVPIGTTEGAVNTVVAPSAVWAGVSVPHAPFVMLPLTGLPPQVTVQSTPALIVSPDGIILSFNVEPIESALPVATTPLEFATEIGPALTPDAEPPPQPVNVMLIVARQREPYRPTLADRSRHA